MKFTEEQFQTLVKAYEYSEQSAKISENDDFYFEFYQYSIAISKILKSIDKELYLYINGRHLGNEAIALMNPRTRDWAHEQYVEKENKYVWTLKKVDKSGIKMRLYKEYFGRVRPFFSVKNVNIDDSEKLTETEVKEWGYNPEMFDKEEVK